MKMDRELERMWTSDRDEYVLLRVGDEPHDSYLPFHLKAGTAVVIEDPSVERWAVQSMLAAGIPIIDHIPDAGSS